MTLAASGTMSLAGTATGRSVQVALGGDGSTQISMNDAAVRALAGEATGPISMTDFHGKSAAAEGITARYIRLTGFTKSVSAGPMITQFALYTDANLTNLIIGQNANSNPTIPELSANVTLYSGWSPNKAGSASATSGWYLGSRSSSLIINDWIQYDMGSPIAIGSILVRDGYHTYTHNYWLTGFNVEHSNDGTNWTLIEAVTNTSGPNENTINTAPVPPPPAPVILDVVTVTQGSLVYYSTAYFGFEGWRNPDNGSVSPTSLTISGTSYNLHSLRRRVSHNNAGVYDDSTSSFYFTVYEAADGSVPADNWFSSMILGTSGDPVTLTSATASVHTITGRKEWRWFYDDFTSAEITALSAEWNGSGTSTVTFME